MQHNLTDIYNLLYSFSTGTTEIKDFQFGNLSEITTNKSQQYPLMYVELDKGIAKEQTMQINFNILIGKQENHDRSDRITIYSDMLNLQNKLIGFMQENVQSEDYDIGDGINLTPFSMRFNNLVTGWFMTLPIITNRFNDQC